MTAIATSVLYVGFLLLSMSLEKHYKQVLNKEFTQKFKYIVTALGYLFLLISFVLYIQLFGFGLGATYWVGALTPIVVLIALLLSYRPKLILKISAIILLLSIVSIL